MEFKLHQIGTELVAGPIFHPRGSARELFRFARDRMAAQPDELLVHLGIVTLEGGVQAGAMIPVFVGPIPEGEAAVAPFRSFGAPIVDAAGPMPYLTLQGLFEPAYPNGKRNYWKSAFVDQLSDALIDAMVDAYASAPNPAATFFLEQMGGAIDRVAGNATAFPHRGAAYNFLITTAWDDPADDEANIRWLRETWAAIEPHLNGGVYVNYLSDRQLEGSDRVRASYGANYAGLTALKQQYDPQNRFRHNQNIVPSAS